MYVEQTRLGGPCCFKNTQPLRPGTYTLLVRPLLNQTGTLTFRFDIDDITTDVYKSTTLNEYYPLACGSIAGPQIVYVEFPNTMINQSATLVVTLFAVPMGQEPLCVNAVLLNGSYSGCSPYCTPSGDCSATVVLSATATLTNPIGTLYTAMVDALYGAGGVSAQVTSP